MNTIRPQMPMLIESIIPSQSEIRMRMEINYGKASKLVQAVIAPCAEEAERILCELYTTKSMKIPVTIHSLLHKGSRHSAKKRISGYQCPKCKYNQIRIDAIYCPGCGKPIEWEHKQYIRKDIKKFQPQKITSTDRKNNPMPLQTFAKNLRHLRLQRGYSQTDIARILGLKKPMNYQHWEKGRCWPSTHEQLLRLCDILGVVSIDKFIRTDMTRTGKKLRYRKNTCV
jgi:DNA-binding transcriptional regulator YiaG